ncbi:MAG: hypothetical protein R2710_24935 [Acidimicrobiales bacterium]
MIDSVDPFIGTGVTDLPPPEGLAATWWFPQTAGRQHSPRSDRTTRHGLGLRLLRRLPDRVRAL